MTYVTSSTTLCCSSVTKHYLVRFLRHWNKRHSDPVVRKNVLLLVQALFPVVDVGQDVEVRRVSGKDVPPAVELGQRHQDCRSNDAKPLERVAKHVVQDPEEESDQVPDGANAGSKVNTGVSDELRWF